MADDKIRDLNGETGKEVLDRHKRDYGVDLNEDFNVWEDPIGYYSFFLVRLRDRCALPRLRR